jgi:glycosyltransferase involved in cell wall biosynthesis
MRVSVVIPAHNEEELLPRCLDSIIAGVLPPRVVLEVVVVANRCTDRTAQIARERGARVIEDASTTLAGVRNRGVHEAKGEIILTIDADSWMTPDSISGAVERLLSGRYVGGGALIRPERLSLGIFFSALSVMPYLAKAGVSAGLFWFFKKDFEAIGGFDENRVSAEDLDFALRLRRHGKSRGLKFGTLCRGYIWTSCRKFDIFGDWHLLLSPRLVHRLLRGNHRPSADAYYYHARSPRRAG